MAIAKVVVDTVNIDAEAKSNMWSFSLSSDEAKIVTVHNVNNFITGVIRARTRQLQDRGLPSGSMDFYCWHDEQAGQLKFSLVSRSHGCLPFGAKLQQVDLATIIRSWLSSPSLHGIPSDELAIVDFGDPETLGRAEEYVLQVWSTLI